MKKMDGIVATSIGLLMFCLASCLHDKNLSETTAEVTEEQLAMATEIVFNLDYIPFGFRGDGCYARSFYMSMELAVARIPSSAQTVAICAPDMSRDFFNDSENLLALSDGTAWMWHVAPLVVLNDEKYILDPSMGQSLMTRSQWMGMMRRQHPVNFVLSPAAYPSSGRSHDGPCDRDEGYEQMISHFSQLGSFDDANILAHCQTLRRQIWALEDKDDVEKQEMDRQLISRTEELLNLLKQNGKLIESRPINRPPLDLEVDCHI